MARLFDRMSVVLYAMIYGHKCMLYAILNAM